MCLWSTVAICQCRITGVKTFYATRALLGLLEGGFIPDVVLYLSFFYKSKELPIRLSYFWGAFITTYIISALLGYGILHLRGVNGWEGWRFLFAIEGGMTALIGITAWFYLPPSPTQTASWFRGKDGWFSEHEEKIMVNRILRDDPSKGGMHNRQGLTLGLLWEALCDYDLWPVYLLGLTWTIPATPITAYLTLNLKELGFSTFETNLLTIPAYVLFLIQLLVWTWVSERWNNRFMIVLISQIWCFPLVLGLELMPGNASPWSWYVCSLLLVGYPYVHAILVAITSRNAGSVRTRTVGSALYNMCVQASSIISSNVSLCLLKCTALSVLSSSGADFSCADISNKRCPRLSHGQQGDSWNHCVDILPDHRYQVLLYLEKREQGEDLERHVGGRERRVSVDNERQG